MTTHLFTGLKVIDCASWIAGPAAATIFSDFVADVTGIPIRPSPGCCDRGHHRSPAVARVSEDTGAHPTRILKM